MIERFPWANYSAKLVKSIVKPIRHGRVEPVEGMRLVLGREGDVEIFLLVDEDDGIIFDAKFEAFGETLLIGAAEIVCELALRKNYAQAKRMSVELVEKSVEDRVQKKGFPAEGAAYIHLVLDALDKGLAQCEGLPMPEEFLVTPVDLSELEKGDYPNWAALTHEERLGHIQEVLAHEIAPYVQIDDGNVVLKELQGELRVVIQYEGNCTTCISATGSTLSAIQQILRARIHPQLEVVPDLSSLPSIHHC